jgi:hypothetical protein
MRLQVVRPYLMTMGETNMTTSIKDQSILPSWPVDKIQQVNAKCAAAQIVERLKLSEHESDAEFRKIQAEHASMVASQIKQEGVKTPLGLVQKMAEHQANLFGAEVAISGDDSRASLIFKKPTVWMAVNEMIKMTPEQKSKSMQQWQEWLTDLGKEFGFSVKVDAPDDTRATVTFSR